MPAFTPTTPLTPGTFTAVSAPSTRRVRYGDHPRLGGSIKYGQLIAGSGFMTRATYPAAVPFTPSS